MLEEYLRQFLEHLRYERNVSTHTLRNYSSDLYQFHEHIAPPQSNGTRMQIPVKDVDHLTIREWMANLHGLNKKKTSIARKLASLRTFFQFLVREGVLDNNPAKLVATATPIFALSRLREECRNLPRRPAAQFILRLTNANSTKPSTSSPPNSRNNIF